MSTCKHTCMEIVVCELWMDARVRDTHEHKRPASRINKRDATLRTGIARGLMYSARLYDQRGLAVCLSAENTVPTLTFNSNVTVVEGVTYTFDLMGYDPDTGDHLQYFAVSNGSGTVQLNPTTGIVTVRANSSIPVNMS